MPKPSPAGHFSILYFASASSYTRKASDTLPAPLPLARLFDTLEGLYPGIRGKVLESCAVTVNLEYVDLELDEAGEDGGGEGRVIKEGDEVGIIPPVSSG